MTTHEAKCLAEADHFTAVRGRNPFTRTRSRHATLEEAQAAGLGDGRTMIYAVTATGSAAHICNA